MAEEFRSDELFMIAADLPGLKPDGEVSVAITSDVLHIRAWRNDGASVPGSDLRDGPFSRDVRLPAGADQPKVSATYADGVLKVKVPMRDHKGVTRMVPVSCGGGGIPDSRPASVSPTGAGPDPSER